MCSIGSITCGYWNINGHRSKYLGDKLVDQDFLKCVAGCDIIGLGEIHSEGAVDITGYVRVKQKIREKKFRGPKIAGGIGVFVKKEISHLIQVVNNDCKDSIWIKIKNTEIYIGTYYVSPYNAKTKDFDFFNMFNDEISHFSNKGTVLVQGDLNARISNNPDFITSGKVDHLEEVEALSSHFTEGSILEEENDQEYIPRNSEDRKENPRGNELLDICKINNLIVLNGRKTGDLFGKCTSHNWNGSSVVDYFICPTSFYDRIISFSVGQYIPWISDHCIIKTVFYLSVVVNHIPERAELTEELHPGYLWNEESIERFKKGLKDPLIEGRIETLLNSPSIQSISLAKEIQKLLTDTVHTSKIKPKKRIDPENKSEPWFDKECESEKKKVRTFANKVKKNPQDDICRSQLRGAKKEFKKIIMAKKRRYRTNIFKKLQDEKENHNKKEYWKIFRKISPKNKKGAIKPGLMEFHKYFEKLSNTERVQDFPDLCKENGPLDYIISLEELEDAGKKLKFGKSVGTDYIYNEMISTLMETHPKLILKLFNSILQSGDIIPEWLMGMIVAIHKDGPKLDTGNYRGITLMSCLGKLFLSILNARMMEFVLGNNILSKSALGFVPGNRTSDAHIIINNLVNKICHKEGSKIFSCFVDFKKAFDSVPRDLLLKKLLKHGINGKFFNIIRTIYLYDKACVKDNGKKSMPFDINLGVRQGCVLSPLLFNIFICDLAKKLMEQADAPEIGQVSINSLFWADDLVLFSKDEVGLQNLLNILEKYCKENKLTINTKKTKCMIFNKTGRLLLRPFYLDGVQLEMVRSYKYLGFLITPSGEYKTGLKDLRDRAMRAFMKIRNDLGTSFNQDILLTLSLIDTLVKPILLYVSDFWGCMDLKKSNTIENLYMGMLKQILGVQKQTTNIGVLLELGKVPIILEAKKLAIKNWERIKKGDGNFLLNASYQNAMQESLPWIVGIKNTLDANDFQCLYLDDHSSKPPFVYLKLYERLVKIFHEESFETIQREDSKLRTYSLFKKEKGFEPYLSEIKNVSLRTKTTKLRLSNHKLMIEVGRHQGINKDNRFCPFCPGHVEDEYHFLFLCPTYKAQRDIFMAPMVRQYPNFSNFHQIVKMELIMSKVGYDLCNFVGKSFEIREFLIEKPKRNE